MQPAVTFNSQNTKKSTALSTAATYIRGIAPRVVVVQDEGKHATNATASVVGNACVVNNRHETVVGNTCVVNNSHETVVP